MGALDGTVVVITGAGRGIGRHLACALAKDGAAIGAVALNRDGLDETIRLITDDGGEAIGVTADVAAPEQIDDAEQVILDTFGRVDALINNAGLQLGKWNTLMELPLDDWRRLFDVNVLGAFVCARAFRSALSEQRGAIVNQSSIAAYGAQFGAYGVSKTALNGMTMALAHELAPDGIRVNGVAPGVIITDELRELGQTNHEARDFQEWIVDQQLVKRLGAPSDLVGLMRFLCSAESSFVTGQTFVVDGGLSPRL
jgi:NAD(P)-dependent dehydrogenase (short-subunit alcohol dehydrogenase family)